MRETLEEQTKGKEGVRGGEAKVNKGKEESKGRGIGQQGEGGREKRD